MPGPCCSLQTRHEKPPQAIHPRDQFLAEGCRSFCGFSCLFVAIPGCLFPISRHPSCRGLDRLLEDTLDPNRNVDQAFRLTTLQLKKGQVVSGLLLREEGALLVLADGQGKEVRIAKDAVEERSTSQQSPMPANFADQISESDFYNLLAYLLGQRVAAPNAK